MVDIRAATVDDARALAALSEELGYPAHAAEIARRLDDIESQGAGVVVVAAESGVVRGFAHALPQYFLSEGAFVELAALVVAGDARRLGVGKALLAAVEDWSRDRGFTLVQLRSNVVRERAHRFYLREGYAERKRQAVFFKRLG